MSRARALVPVVLVEALGSSVTPFIPLPFVDDWIFEGLLRRIVHKVAPAEGSVEAAVVAGYVRAGASPMHTKALTAAVRFVIRKVAVILDVKKGHDVFGEAIAFAFALDIAVAEGRLASADAAGAAEVGAAMYRSTQSLGSAAIEVVTRAVRTAIGKTAGEASSGLARTSEAIGAQVDAAYARLSHLMAYELSRPARTHG